jgi:stage IV sporulation protein FB
MDGGRVLRALLAKKTTHARATQIASQVGQGFALMMGLWGFMSGSWTLVIIAIFVWMGAGQENQGTQTRHVLGEATVGQVMTRAPHSVKVNDSLSKAVELTLSTSQSEFPVLEWESNRVAGLLTQADLVRGLKNLGSGAAMREVMQIDLPYATLNEPLSQARQKMLKGRTRALPVLNSEGELIGLLSADDVTEAYRLMSVNRALAVDAR